MGVGGDGGATGTRMRLGRICLLQTGHQVESKAMSIMAEGEAVLRGGSRE